MSYTYLQYGYSDDRTPYIPNDKILEGFLAGKVGYPSPYIKGFERQIACERDFVLNSKQDIVCNGLVHSLKRIVLVSEREIKLLSGSVLIANDITLWAPEIKILDDSPFFSVRTTIFPRERLEINVTNLEIVGADIYQPKSHQLAISNDVKIVEVTQNTNWLTNFFWANQQTAVREVNMSE